MMITYGHRVAEKNDEFVQLAEKVRENGNRFPAGRLIDLLPIRTCVFYCLDRNC